MEVPMAFDSGAPLTSPSSRHSLATADGTAATRWTTCWNRSLP